MLISIFTPTHDTGFLGEVYDSLREQDDELWEWVIVPNGEVGPISDSILADDRVRVCPAPTGMSGIGRLKKYACTQCHGEYFLELDHDDLLTRGALKTIREWIEKEDRPVIEGMRPEYSPRDTTSEMLLPEDEVMVSYRRYLDAWQAKGWHIDVPQMRARSPRKVFAIPSPGRREHKNWIMDTVPLLGAE
mgnify:CR=1 FL=1